MDDHINSIQHNSLLLKALFILFLLLKSELLDMIESLQLDTEPPCSDLMLLVRLELACVSAGNTRAPANQSQGCGMDQ